MHAHFFQYFRKCFWRVNSRLAKSLLKKNSTVIFDSGGASIFCSIARVKNITGKSAVSQKRPRSAEKGSEKGIKKAGPLRAPLCPYQKPKESVVITL